MTATLEAPADTQAKLADGTPFQLGMTVYLPVGGIASNGDIQRIDTDPETHAVRRFVHDGLIYNSIAVKGSGADLGDTSFLYPSRESVLDARIALLEAAIDAGCERLVRLRAERNLGS